MKKLLLFIFVVLTFVACKQEKLQSKSKELTLTTVAIRSLDSVMATDSASLNIIQNTQETLLIYKDNLPVLGAAKSFTVSKDGLVYTFLLKNGLKWSDGKPLTSKDYLYAFKRLLSPATGASYAFFLFPIKGANDYYKGKASFKDVGLSTPDDHTLKVTLAYKVPYFTQLIAFPALAPQREDLVEKYGQAYATKTSNMVFSGPFVVSDWVKGSKIVLKKNPYYWDAANIKLDVVKFLQVKEFSTQYQMFMDKQLDVVEGNTGEFIKRYNEGVKKGLFARINVPLPRQYFMTFNFKKKEFASKKVRLAFSAALNREEFVSKVLKTGIPAYGFVTNGIMVGDLDYRKEVAQPLLGAKIGDPKALLIEGLKELGLDPNPAAHSFELLQRKNDAQMKIEGEYLKNMWEKALGVRITLLAAADFADFLDKDQKGLFDISYQGWGADYNSPLTFLDYYTSWNSYNTGKYHNAQVDLLIKQTAKESGARKRLELFKQVENIYVLGDPATAPLYYKDENIYLKNNIKGLDLTLFGGKYQLRFTSVE